MGLMKFNSYKIFVKRAGLLGITNILVVITSIILTPILTKTLPITDYGIWIQVNTTYLLITGINTLGLSTALVRYLSAEKNKRMIQESFYSMLVIIAIVSFITSLIMCYFSKPISISLFNGNDGVVMITSVIIFFGSLNVLLIDYFRAFERMKLYSLLILIQSYFSLFLVSYFALSNQGINIIVSALLITQVTIFFITIPIIIRDIGFKFPKFKKFKEYLNFGLPTVPSSLSYWMVDSSDRYFLAFLLGAAFVGYYSPGYILGTLIFLFFTPLALILPASLPKLYENAKIDEVDSLIKYSLKYFLLVAIPSVFALSLLSKPILLLLTTPEIALNGYLVTPFIAFSSLLMGMYGIITNHLLLKKKTGIMGGIWIFAAILSLLNLVFIPYFGIIGAAIVTLISYTFAFILGLFYTLKYAKIYFEYIFILKSVISSIILSIIIILIKPEGVFDLIIVFGVSIIIYVFCMFLFRGVEKDEIQFFKNIFLKD